MKNIEVIKAFLNGKSGASANMYTEGVKLYSYDIVIAEKVYIGYTGKCNLLLNVTNYSNITTKHQNMLNQQLDDQTKNRYQNIFNLDNVPEDEMHLYNCK